MGFSLVKNASLNLQWLKKAIYDASDFKLGDANMFQGKVSQKRQNLMN